MKYLEDHKILNYAWVGFLLGFISLSYVISGILILNQLGWESILNAIFVTYLALSFVPIFVHFYKVKTLTKKHILTYRKSALILSILFLMFGISQLIQFNKSTIITINIILFFIWFLFFFLFRKYLSKVLNTEMNESED
ncbi:hypothetical protein BVX98_06195 [bacterium F11]|nr:hypothetical protein BVX98_06195 [bacterium F11]